MKGVVLVNKKDIENIIRLYKKGESIKRLTEKYPISDRSIKKILKEYGIHVRNINEASLRKDKHTNWKGGKITDKRGYIFIYNPKHPSANKMGSGYVPEHRLVMEKKLGRYLTKDEVVHHIDGNPKNNKLKNLRLYKRWSHNSLHSKQLKLDRDSQGMFLKKGKKKRKNLVKTKRDKFGRFIKP